MFTGTAAQQLQFAQTLTSPTGLGKWTKVTFNVTTPSSWNGYDVVPIVIGWECYWGASNEYDGNNSDFWTDLANCPNAAVVSVDDWSIKAQFDRRDH